MSTRTVSLLIAAFAVFAYASSTTVWSQTPSPSYVGSKACQRCHAPTYERWSKTRMANVVTDPKQHPDAVIPDFSKPDPLLTFTLADVAFVYGSEVEAALFHEGRRRLLSAAARSGTSRTSIWRPYLVAAEHRLVGAALPGATTSKRPTGPLCDGCHSVNYNIQTKTVTEWNVGCERCHGPGSEHVRQPTAANIVNPAKLDFVRANDTCIQCHSQGQPLTNPIAGQVLRLAGRLPSGRQAAGLLEARGAQAGRDDLHALPRRHRAQEPDAGQRLRAEPDVHARRHLLQLPRRPRHRRTTPICIKPVTRHLPHLPRPDVAERTARARRSRRTRITRAGSAGSECVACHMPKIEQTIADVNVRSHTFAFITPELTDQFKIPNSCTASCHTDKDTKWVRDTLKTWANVSPWRIGA